MARKHASSAPPLVLEGDLDVFSIHAQWEQALSLQGSESPTLSLDLSGIGDLDLSGIQLLCALEREAKAKGRQLVLSGIKDEWKARFGPMGFEALFAGGTT